MPIKPKIALSPTSSVDKYERELLSKKFQGFLQSGDYAEEEQYFSTYHSESVATQRMSQHFYGKTLMLQEKINEASQALERTVTELGPHVGLLADLSLCAYVREDFLSWRQWVKELESNFEQHQMALSNESQLRTMIVLAKAAEEEGRLSVASKYYRLAQEKAKGEGGRWEVLSQAQRLRLSAHYGLQDNLGVFYARLMSLIEGQPDWDSQFEVQHALMTAEFRLVGKKVALIRLNRTLQNSSWNITDRNLMIFDFLELCIHSSQFEAQSDLQLLKATQPETSKEFQRTARLFEGETLNMESLLQMPQPHAGYIRLLGLALALNRCEDAVLAGKQLLLLLDSTDGDSKEIWNRWLSWKQDDGAVSYSAEKKILSYHNQTMPVKVGLAEWLELFKETQTISFEDLSQQVWGLEYSESVFHRIRMRVKRINDEVRRHLGVAELFSIENNKIKLSVSIDWKV